jgi:hypothetical protein
LPPVLSKLQRRGLEIRWCKDLGPHTKLIHALKAFSGALIVTADDDCFNSRNWLGDLYNAYLAQPQYIHCHRAHLMRADDNGALLPYRQWDICSNGFVGPSTMLFPTGVGGVLYAPDHLDGEVFDENVFRSICPKADDVWFKAMSLKSSVNCKKIRPYSSDLIIIRGSQAVSLEDHNDLSHGGNDDQLKAVFEKFNLWGSLLSNRTARQGVEL